MAPLYIIVDSIWAKTKVSVHKLMAQKRYRNILNDPMIQEVKNFVVISVYNTVCLLDLLASQIRADW